MKKVWVLLVSLFAWPAAAEPAARDTRIAVTVTPAQSLQQLQNMRDFLQATQEIVGALTKDDYAAAEAAAKRMGYTEERANKARVVAGSVSGFAETAITFFKSADAVAAAAQKKDHKTTLEAVERMMNWCNGCHATFKLSSVEPAAKK